MRRLRPRFTGLLLIALLLPAIDAPAPAAAAQDAGINWMGDLEAAKTLAKQTNRLVLVHFWTPSCGPCLSLEQTVFNQAGVAAAIEQRFVPVKLDANENSATATGFGITRVPTDVILTGDGHVVGRLISPPTPAGYIAELNQVAAAYLSTPGQGFANAAARAPAPSSINAAYANLPIGSNVPPAAASLASTQIANNPTGSPAPSDPLRQPTMLNNGYAAPATAPSPVAPPPMPVIPSQVENRYASQPPQAPPLAAAQPFPAWPASQPNATTTPIAASSSAPPTPQSEPAQPPLPQYQAAVATQSAPLSAAPDSRQLPPGAPPLGFEGFCPVSMRNHWKWVAGDPRWGIVHRGRTYWFASQAEQQQFWTDPDRFSPALSGMDPVLAIDHQQEVPGKREHSIDYDGLFYMFSSEATLAQFTANPERYAVGARQAMGIPRGRLVR